MKYSMQALVTAVAMLAAMPACAHGQETQAPATQPANPEPAATRAEASQWLEKIEAVSKQVRTLKAELKYDRVQGIVVDTQRRLGTLVYDAGPPARFSLHFDRIIVNKQLRKQDRWFIFDGQWLVERDDEQKFFQKRQVVEPPKAGEPAKPVDLLALGEGPFPVPITLTRERVLNRYNVAFVPPARDDVPDSVHLRLTPRPDRRVDFTQVDLWYDAKTLLPRRVQSVDESQNTSIIDLVNPAINEAVDEKVFDVAAPKGREWHVEITPWE